MTDQVGPGLVGARNAAAVPEPLGDPAAFFAALRAPGGLFAGGFKQSQVDGITALLASAARAGHGIGWTANELGTAYLETNKTMQPVAEAYYLEGKVHDLDAWRRAHLRYYPHYGRGYPQVTWERNYQKADDYLVSIGLIQPGDLMRDLDLMLKEEIAAPVMMKFMEAGWFTGKKLGDYIPAGQPGTPEGHKQARRVINGIDRREDLCRYAMGFQRGLQAGGWRHG